MAGVPPASGKGRGAALAALGVRPLVRRPPRLRDEATERLRDLILQGDLRPGERLLQDQLAGLLGVSRTPLRDALRLLEKEGLIESTGVGSVTVASLTDQDAVEICQIRAVVDGLAARLAAQRGLDRPAVERLRGALEECREAAGAGGNTRLYLLANAEFHDILLEACGNRRLIAQQRSLVRMSSLLWFPRLGSAPGRARESAREHGRILAAVCAGDGEAAEAEARAHIEAATRSWLERSIETSAAPGRDDAAQRHPIS
jgi:DNA-binding GntR family transcriptional regulator